MRMKNVMILNALGHGGSPNRGEFGHSIDLEPFLISLVMVGHDIENEVGFNEQSHGGSRHRK